MVEPRGEIMRELRASIAGTEADIAEGIERLTHWPK
jgi:hypothetical protein